MNNLYKLIAIAILINVGFYTGGLAINFIPEALSFILSIGLLVLFFYFYFDYITKIIYKLANVDYTLKGNPKLDHKSANLISRYWIIWIITTAITNIVLMLTFDRKWFYANLAIGSVGLFFIIVAFLVNRNKIKGYSKEKLFQ